MKKIDKEKRYLEILKFIREIRKERNDPDFALDVEAQLQGKLYDLAREKYLKRGIR